MEQEELKVGDWVRFIKKGEESLPHVLKDLKEPLCVTIGELYEVAGFYTGLGKIDDVGLKGILNPLWLDTQPDRLWLFTRDQLEKVNIFQKRVRKIVNEHESENTSI